jgi:hypothetical protein
MRARPVKTFRQIAVVAKDLEAGRELVSYQPKIRTIAAKRLGLPPMFAPVVVDVVYSKKFILRLATASAPCPVMPKHPLAHSPLLIAPPRVMIGTRGPLFVVLFLPCLDAIYM